MTTEEIAVHLAREYGATNANKESAIYRACIRMATEQKEIDDVRIAELESFVKKATELIEMEKAMREHLEKEIKELETIVELAASVMGIGTKWFSDVAKMDAMIELREKIMNYFDKTVEE